MEVPKKLTRTMKKLAAAGEETVMIVPALLHSLSTQRMLAMSRIGADDNQKIFGYLVVTDKAVHYVMPGALWDKVRTVPLEKIDEIQYLDEFHNNTLKLVSGKTSENIVFYDDREGISFYRHIKSQILSRERESSNIESWKEESRNKESSNE